MINLQSRKSIMKKIIHLVLPVLCFFIAMLTPDWKKPLMAIYYQKCENSTSTLTCGASPTCECVMPLNEAFHGSSIAEDINKK